MGAWLPHRRMDRAAEPLLGDPQASIAETGGMVGYDSASKFAAAFKKAMKLSFALFPSTLIGTLPAALALAACGVITAPQAALAVMLSISMVGSLARLEVFSENMRQVKFTVEELEKFLEMPPVNKFLNARSFSARLAVYLVQMQRRTRGVRTPIRLQGGFFP